MDLFTSPANGNHRVEPAEATDFLILARAGRKILDHAAREILPRCLPGVPEANITGITLQCLNKHFFHSKALETLYGRSLPFFLQEIRDREKEGLAVLQKAMIASVEPARPDLLDRSEFESLLALPVFLENLFLRYDRNFDGRLVFSEAMTAFPVFCEEIKIAAGKGLRGSCEAGANPGQIEAVFGYLLFRKTRPRGIRSEDSLWARYLSARDLFGWFRFWNQLDQSPEVRDALPPALSRIDLLEIMSTVSNSPGRSGPDSP